MPKKEELEWVRLRAAYDGQLQISANKRTTITWHSKGVLITRDTPRHVMREVIPPSNIERVRFKNEVKPEPEPPAEEKPEE